ncbi:MAG TPA: cell wall hydrolase [Sphingomonadaceae bacterium]|nr:cell wall hydrolase [Sphingomonadaceae bacterium]
MDQGLRRGAFTADKNRIMSRKTQLAAAFAAVAMMVFTISGAAASGAFAQNSESVDLARGGSDTEVAAEPLTHAGTEAGAVRFVSREVVQPLSTDDRGDAGDPASLEDLVASLPAAGDMSRDMQCLAGAIYFEARGEPLVGQLAVGKVIVNRAESEKFPASYCGVVYQHSQFSFVRNGRMPAIPTGSAAWRKAKVIARIVHEGLWDSPVRDALYFHAASVDPNWRRARIARVDRHIFYR